jgi:hypothetical protein
MVTIPRVQFPLKTNKHFTDPLQMFLTLLQTSLVSLNERSDNNETFDNWIEFLQGQSDHLLYIYIYIPSGYNSHIKWYRTLNLYTNLWGCCTPKFEKFIAYLIQRRLNSGSIILWPRFVQSEEHKWPGVRLLLSFSYFSDFWGKYRGNFK